MLIPICVQSGNNEVRDAHLIVAALNANWYKKNARCIALFAGQPFDTYNYLCIDIRLLIER
jgi:hypothetical protein